ncbi:HIT domain-containing protein [Rheinheimera riviphila]|uniref:HIT domain-containing protein n=1 Tax=Rheinheimera riviphila TaxID=1834037 RepID=A0A437R4K7_9GAMM|nr:HIT domain-containing protein [Rheinheimera riviphila]RVU41711.1 HIT domain-containing protein [Rheinheimera riviphila]
MTVTSAAASVSREFELHPQLAKDSVWISDWPLCQLRLINDKNYPWFILVPRRSDVREIIDLTDDDQQLLWRESQKLSRLLQQCYAPDKLNIAALGNMVPQLHLHHIGRFTTDAAWPAPVWGKVPAVSYSETELHTECRRWALF